MSRSTHDADVDPNIDEYELAAIPPREAPYEWVARGYIDQIENNGWDRGFVWGTLSGLLLSALLLTACICAWGFNRVIDQRIALFQRLVAPPVVHPFAIPQLRKD